MEYKKDFDVRRFGFWSGAREWYQAFARRDKLGELQSYLEEAFGDRIPTETEVNDCVWFDDALHGLIEDEEDDNDNL